MSAAPDDRAPGTTSDAEHLDDAVLLRLLDGEHVAEDGDAAGHLARCGGCQARLARLRARRGRLAALLAETDAPVPALVVREVPVRGTFAAETRVVEGVGERPARDRALPNRRPERRLRQRRTPVSGTVRHVPERRARGRRATDVGAHAHAEADLWTQTPAYVTPAAIHAVPRARGGLFGRPGRARTGGRTGARLAAAGVALVGAALAAQPVRQWVEARWAALTGPAAEGAAPAGGVPVARSAFDTTAPGAPPPVVVAFTPDRAATAREPFTLHFDERPAGGTLTLRVAPGPRVTAVARPEAGGRPGEFVVLPAGLRVRNAAAPRGTYELTLPAGTNRLRVTFGAPAGDTVLAVGGGAPVVVPLRGQ